VTTPGSQERTRQTQTKPLRLSDNYLRFYLIYEKKLTLIQRDITSASNPDNLPEWLTVMDAVENLVLGSRTRIRESLALDLNSVVNENPTFRRQIRVSPAARSIS